MSTGTSDLIDANTEKNELALSVYQDQLRSKFLNDPLYELLNNLLLFIYHLYNSLDTSGSDTLQALLRAKKLEERESLGIDIIKEVFNEINLNDRRLSIFESQTDLNSSYGLIEHFFLIFPSLYQLHQQNLRAAVDSSINLARLVVDKIINIETATDPQYLKKIKLEQ